MIEKRRYNNIPVSESLCTGQIEKKEHFLLHCSCFKQDRQILFKKISGFRISSDQSNINALLNSESPITFFILRISSAFIMNCFKTGDSLLQL